jgi:hypothetical protein
MNGGKLRNGKAPFLLGLGVGVLVGFLAGRRSGRPRLVPLFRIWRKELQKREDPVDTVLLTAMVRARYDELHRDRPRFAHPVLRLHLEQNVLPVLALYQVLQEEGLSQAAALDEAEHLLKAAFGGSFQLLQLLGRLPAPFTLFRRLTRQAMQVVFPPQGWDVEWLQDDGQILAFNVRGCIYLQVLTIYRAPELTPLFCRADDWFFAGLPPSIRWERTKTLGQGGDCCDFRWRNTGR